MESTSRSSRMSQKQDPRPGQVLVLTKWQEILKAGQNRLAIQLPTGYGKSRTSAYCYANLRQRDKANRMLIMVPTIGQLDQLLNDYAQDLQMVGVDPPYEIVDVGYFGANSVRKHRNGTCQIYAMTIQAMQYNRGLATVQTLLETGRWFGVVDEYHHYGIGKSWGDTVNHLPWAYLLAMSATPHRPDEDSVFGEPGVIVGYRQAVDEKAVKRLFGHSYVYRLDAVDEEGQINSFTTSEFVDAVGSDDEKAIEEFLVNRKMRWSPKYVSPLARIPIERLLRDRLRSGHRLQALIGAMCVSHAELVCEQVRAMFPELKIDWVGTGSYGRSDAENKRILKLFCPKKDQFGNRNPDLDILVHVGIAGEGLDAIHVSEVIHLNAAGKNNSNDQENGRASRYLDGVDANISFDSSSDYARLGYKGEKIMDAMDQQPASLEEEDEEINDVTDLPEEPTIQEDPQIHLFDLELVRIESGQPTEGFKKMTRAVSQVSGIPLADFADVKGEPFRTAVDVYRNMLKVEADNFNAKSIVMQWRNAVANALQLVTGLVVRRLSADGTRIDKNLIGDIKRRINTRKKAVVGEVTEDVDICKQHYQWLKNLETEIKTNDLPGWLK